MKTSLARAYVEGKLAAEADELEGTLSDCPYPPDKPESREWYSGYSAYLAGGE